MLVRIGLVNSVDWRKQQMEVVAVASDGKEGVAAFELHSPDIVITDIRMPKMDGIALIDQIRQVDLNCRIIILSCLEDFELSRKALRYGVTDYLLKWSMCEEEIQSVLSKAVQELSLKYILPQKNTDEKERMNEHKEQLIHTLLSDPEIDEHTIEDAQKLLTIEADQLLLCSMLLTPAQMVPQNKKQLIALSIKSILENSLKGFNYELCMLADGLSVLILNISQIQQVETALRHAQGLLYDYMKQTVQFGLSSVFSGYRNIKLAFDQAELARSLLFFYPQENLFHYHDILKRERVNTHINEMIDEIFASFKQEPIAEQIRMDDLQVFFRSHLERQDVEPVAIRGLMCNLVEMTHQFVHRKLPDTIDLKLNTVKILLEDIHFPALLMTYRGYLQALSNAFATNRLSRDMLLATNYIIHHLSQTITLSDVAQVVHKNTTYLSMLFRKEMGVTFSDYLIQLRIETAKERLENSFLSLEEIAYSVGISEYSYFSRLFKKKVGISPHKYRKNFGGFPEEEQK